MTSENETHSSNNLQPNDEEYNNSTHELVSTSQDSHADADPKVSLIVGKWAMPTTVILVLITCMSGFFLSEAAFTPVVGMIAPVVMALIMVIKEASVGKDEDPGVQDRESERKQRTEQLRHDKEVKLAQMARDERIKNQEIQEQAKQFDMYNASTREFVDLIKEMNLKMTQQLNKPKSTELAIGDTKIKLCDGETSVATTKIDTSNL